MHIVVELLMILLVWRANNNLDSSSETFAYVLHAINIFVIILSWSMVDVRFGEDEHYNEYDHDVNVDVDVDVEHTDNTTTQGDDEYAPFWTR